VSEREGNILCKSIHTCTKFSLSLSLSVSERGREREREREREEGGRKGESVTFELKNKIKNFSFSSNLTHRI
jgi:hypothetical protein